MPQSCMVSRPEVRAVAGALGIGLAAVAFVTDIRWGGTFCRKCDKPRRHACGPRRASGTPRRGIPGKRGVRRCSSLPG